MAQLSLKKPFKIVLKVHGSFFLGAIISLALLQEDPWLKTRLERIIQHSVADVIKVPFSCKLSGVDLLGGTITVTDMYAASSAGTWTFSCPETIIRFSWLSWLKHAAFEARLIFQKAVVFSSYENKQWAIVDPFIKLIRAPMQLPITLMGCTFSQGMVNLARDTFRFTMQASSGSDIFKDLVTTRIFVGDGALHRGSVPWAEHITGTVAIDVPVENVDNYTVKMNVMADLPFVQKVSQRSLLMYTYKNSLGSWQWYPEDRSIMIKAEGITFNEDGSICMETEIAGLVEKAALYLPFIPLLKTMQGQVTGQATVHVADDTFEYEGSAKAQDLAYQSMRLGKAFLKIKGNKQKVSGTIDFDNAFGAATRGNWNYDLVTETADSSWNLLKKYTRFPKIVIEKEGTEANLSYKGGLLTGTMLMKTSLDESISANGTKNKKAILKGIIKSDPRELLVDGTFDEAPFKLRMQLNPSELTYFSYTKNNKNGKKSNAASSTDRPVKGRRRYGKKAKEVMSDCPQPNDQVTKGGPSIKLEKKNGVLEGTIDFEYIKDMLMHFFQFQAQGSAVVGLRAYTNKTPMVVDVTFSDGNIKIPEAHNFIKEAHASISFDPSMRCLTVKKAHVQLQKGSVSSGCATLLFSDTGSLTYAHLPCSAHDAFIGWNKDFFGMFSGAVTGVYTMGQKGGRWMCTGALTLDKAHLRSNLLSSQVQKDLLRSSSDLAKNVELDLHFSTKSPLQVKTFFFNTNTEINALVKGTVAQPLVTGIIELNKGSFLFPYKPLYVSLGKLYLSPDQPDDPVIQLTAKNTIKKYVITMHVSGTVHQPKISFEASPSLSEEQIITLLLSGSEEGPWYLAMPNLVIMHIESLLFDSDEHSSKAQQFFKTLLKPLKNVRFVPTLSSEEGKGFQGTIEVDFTDRLRAKAKNNLKLSQDTKFEVEYSLSDDMTVKAIRDDAGSLGGEVEMRWKF